MFNFLLSGVDKVMAEAGPFNRLVGAVADKLVPNKEAMASGCTTTVCNCSYSSSGNFSRVVYYFIDNSGQLVCNNNCVNTYSGNAC